AAWDPIAITAQANNPIVAAFWADVDTRTASPPGVLSPGGNSTGSDLVYSSLDTVNHTLTITWDDVGYFDHQESPSNAFQIQLIGLGNGDFDILFRYEAVNWTAGQSSGVARAGYTAGDGNSTHYFEL